MNESTAPDLAAALPDIAFQRFTLDNGLTLLVHEDAASPTVAVHVTYGVGAKNESTGQFGLAHLMEHLMFSGTAALPGSYITHLERAGAEGPERRHQRRYHPIFPVGATGIAGLCAVCRIGSHGASGGRPSAAGAGRAARGGHAGNGGERTAAARRGAGCDSAPPVPVRSPLRS